ncbi:F-box and leucine-rich repeat protein 13-like [Styela clava]|uniref:dynein regulatory complex subunit 6-like n=1 Tax=Styela clava TaxID=7725 RepID=UPI001939E5CD|nr:dynein regulatory complex subunit 6-like [Styela clava]
MASLQGIDPALKEYLKVHQLPEVYECILTGLMIACPEDPYKWVVESIKKIRDQGLDTMTWDMFVPFECQPKIKQMAESYLDEIFKFYDKLTPSPDMLKAAYSHYYGRLQKICFKGWLKYYLDKKNHRNMIRNKVKEARQYHRTRMMRISFSKWHTWKCYVKKRQNSGFDMISKVWNESVCRLVFRAWRSVAVDARKTREYFERLERGELDEEFGVETGDKDLPSDTFRDEVSLLPRRCAIQIFSNLNLIELSRCAKVCRAWKVITGAPSLWSHLNFSRIKNKVNDRAIIQCLQKSRPYLVHLNLRQCFAVHWPAFKAIAECRNLQDINISECKGVNDEIIRAIAEGCPVLLYLNLSYTEITDGTLRTLARCCLNMQYLSLAYCNKFTDRGLYYLATGKGCKKLTYLDLSGCTQITPQGFKHISNGCNGLQSLFLNDLHTLTDSCLTNIAEKCLNIKGLYLIGSPNLSDSSFKALAQGKRLQKVRIEGNQKISDNTFKTFGKLCPMLGHIYVVDCQRITDMMLKALASLRNIIVINVADCVRISDSGVRQLVEGPSGPKIREMNLTNCVRVSDVSLLRIAQRCHGLTHLSLCFCEHVTDAGIELLGNMVSLTHVDLSGTNIQDQGLTALGTNSRLKSIVISECSSITDLGLQKFCQQVKELEELDVSHCMTLTDTAIKNLAFCCRMLTSLNLSGCPLFTDLSIQYLSGVCHYIHILNISGCIHISDRALKYLRKGCAQLRVLIMLYCKSVTKAMAHKFRSKLEKLEYSSDEVPSWFNYAVAPSLHGKKKPVRADEGPKWIELEDTE